jgi:hypothetical protein
VSKKIEITLPASLSEGVDVVIIPGAAMFWSIHIACPPVERTTYSALFAAFANRPIVSVHLIYGQQILILFLVFLATTRITVAIC